MMILKMCNILNKMNNNFKKKLRRLMRILKMCNILNKINNNFKGELGRLILIYMREIMMIITKHIMMKSYKNKIMIIKQNLNKKLTLIPKTAIFMIIIN